MAKYKLAEYEENKYDDSDGFIIYWDSESQSIDRVCHWTTRCGSFDFPMSEYLDPTPEIVEQACASFAKKIARYNIRSQIRAHYEPRAHHHLKPGDDVVFKQKHNSRKCGIKVEVGTVAKVISVQIDNYKSNSRYDIKKFNVFVQLGNKIFKVPMDKLRGAGKPKFSIKKTKELAKKDAYSCHFRSMWYGGWDCTNWARKVLEANKEQKAS